MKFRQIDDSPQIFILVFQIGDKLADGLLQFAKEESPAHLQKFIDPESGLALSKP